MGNICSCDDANGSAVSYHSNMLLQDEQLRRKDPII